MEPKKSITVKIKWNYDKKHKEWYVIETVPYANDTYTISKTTEGQYILVKSYFQHIGHFKKLGNAKKVVELLKHG